jgi:hypothetical protein
LRLRFSPPVDSHGGLHGEVVITLGTGDVDYDAIFNTLR